MLIFVDAVKTYLLMPSNNCVKINKGPSLNDVTQIFEILDPPTNSHQWTPHNQLSGNTKIYAYRQLIFKILKKFNLQKLRTIPSQQGCRRAPQSDPRKVQAGKEEIRRR